MRKLAHAMLSRRRAAQKGQAIVLIALMMTVLLGMVALAIDSGRGYVDRREVQDAVDAAALAAADSYANYNSPAAAEQLAIAVYAENERITVPGFSYYTSNPQTYLFPGTTHKVTIQVAFNAFNGTIFTVTGYHTIPVSMMQVLGIFSLPVSALARSVIGSQNATPALLALSNLGCPSAGPQAALNLGGGVTVTVQGDVYSNGFIAPGGSGAQFDIAGNVYQNCGAPIGFATYYCYDPYDFNDAPHAQPCAPWETYGTGYSGAATLPDPSYPSGNLGLYTNHYTVSGGGIQEINPGIYDQWNITGGSGCYFLANGVYQYTNTPNGYYDHGAMTSNELKPPDEPLYYDYTQRQPVQFWDAGGCAPNPGFQLTDLPGTSNGITQGTTWGIRVTSTRYAVYPPGGTAYPRESAPSMCRTVNIGGGHDSIKVDIYKVPGATGYNVYAAPNGCNGPFGYVTHVDFSPNPTSWGTSPYPSVSVTLDTTNTPNPFTPTGTQCSYGLTHGGQVGCAPPDEERSPYNTPDSTTTAPINNGQSYSSIPVVAADSFKSGQTVYLADGKGHSQALTVGSGSSSTLLSVNSFNANFTYPTGSIVAGPSSGLANENPPKGLLPSGDEANEYLCLPQSGIASNPCNGAAVTPGGVQFYFAGQSCLDENGNGATNVFSGKQFNWIVIYMPATNTCSPTLNGGSFTQYIGTIYMPGANLSVNGGNKAPISGQVIVSTANLSGSAGVSITYNPDTAPTPPAARLIQ